MHTHTVIHLGPVPLLAIPSSLARHPTPYSRISHSRPTFPSNNTNLISLKCLGHRTKFHLPSLIISSIHRCVLRCNSNISLFTCIRPVEVSSSEVTSLVRPAKRRANSLSLSLSALMTDLAESYPRTLSSLLGVSLAVKV